MHSDCNPAVWEIKLPIQFVTSHQKISIILKNCKISFQTSVKVMLLLTYLGLILYLGPQLTLSNDCVLEKGRRVKNLATKTPYAFCLDDVTKNDQLDVSYLIYLWISYIKNWNLNTVTI